MKKWGIVIGVFCLIGTLGFGGEKTFSFLISGGVTHLNPHDLNIFLQDYARYFYGGTTAGQNFISKELRTSSELEFTLLIRLAPRVFLTFGSGLINTSLETQSLVKEYTDLKLTFSRHDAIKAIPIRIGLLYSWPVSRHLSIGPHVSLDGYISSFKESGYEERSDFPFGSVFARDDWEIKTHAFSWGSTVGLTLDVGLWSWISLCLDGGYRRARLSGFHGTDVRSESGGFRSERDFRLLYYEFYASWMDTGFKFLNLPFALGGPSLDVVRDAVLDLSGPYLKAGLRVSF